jgi:leader peptidase (prepilin peptidase)/N-methyltransferase
VTSASFEELQEQEIVYSKLSIWLTGLVTFLLAGGQWLAGHHAFAIALVFLIPAAFVDARERLLPDALTLPALGGALVYNGFLGHAVEASIGAGLGILCLMIVFYVRPGRVGLGDVKLIAAFGAALGPQGMLASIILGALVGIGIFTFSPQYRAHGVPMGPVFVGAAIIVGLATMLVPMWAIGI